MACSITFDPEQLNFFKICTVVVDEFPVALRRVFVRMWDNLASNLPSFQQWDDSTAVRTMFLNMEGGTTKVPTNKSYEEWDCTALFQATLFAKCFGMPDSSGTQRTLHKLYVKPRGLPSGTFHPSVLSPSGNQTETFALALDQLRLLRNTLCHQTSTRRIDKTTFDRYIGLAKDAFFALGQATAKIDDIEDLDEQDFPTDRSRKLEDELKKEKDSAIKFGQIECHLQEIVSKVNDVTSEVKEIKSLVEDVKSDVHDANETLKQSLRESLKGGLGFPASCVPDAIPHFIGRQEECDAILHHLTTGETRLVNVWGPPGFGKTSVATNVARKLHEKKLPVYFIPAKGMTTKDELVSKLLSVFSEACNQVPHIATSDRLIQCLRRLPNRSVLILDNVDDLVESGESKTKEDVLRFTEDILSQCNAVKLLYTTRESMDYFSHKVPIRLEKIGVLDEVSSINLVRSMLPGVPSEIDCYNVTETCGRVPLAMRLMCSIVKDEHVSVEELLEELKSSPLVAVLDNESLPNDARLKALISSSLERLPDEEKKAFVSLAVFPGCFREKAASHVLKTESIRRTKRIIHSLERKSLIDSSDNFESFTIHSLLQSFIDEKRKNDKDIDNVFQTARARFHSFFISTFETANNDFLTGRSLEALKEFVAERENIVSSLLGSIEEEALFYDVVTALSKAELFLYAVFTNEHTLFNKLYDKAVKEAQKRYDYLSERQLLAAKAFSHLGWFHTSFRIWDESLLAGKANTDGLSPKLLCYLGVHQLLSGNFEDGFKSLTHAVDRLGCRRDEVVLKVLAYHILAVCYRSQKNEKMASHYKTLSVRECLSEENSLALRFLFTSDEREAVEEQNDLSNSVIEDDFILAHLMAELLSSIYTECADFTETKDMTYGLERFHKTLIALIEKVRGEHADTAQSYYDLGVTKYNMGDLRGSLACHTKALTMRRRLIGDHIDTAASYDQIGCVCLKLGDHKSAIDSFHKALDLNTSLLGEHVDTAQSYHDIGVAKCDMGDFSGSVVFLTQALEMRQKLLGDHTDTATSYDQLGCVYRKMGDLEAAGDSFRHAANLRTKLLGDHVDTGESFFDLGLTRFEMGDYKGALESHQQAVRLRQKLLGDHADTASSFELLGLTYRVLDNHKSSFESLQSALDTRTRLLNDCRNIASAGGNTWWMDKYKEVLASQQNTLKMMLESSGPQSDAAVKLIEIGLVSLDTGDVAAAQQSFEQAWDLAKVLLGIDEEPCGRCKIKKPQYCCLL